MITANKSDIAPVLVLLRANIFFDSGEHSVQVIHKNNKVTNTLNNFSTMHFHYFSTLHFQISTIFRYTIVTDNQIKHYLTTKGGNSCTRSITFSVQSIYQKLMKARPGK